MRVLAFSDVHGSRGRTAALAEASAKADLVIGAGDFCNMRQGLGSAMAAFEGLAAPAILVPGNAESVDELRAAAPWATVLHGDAVTVAGVAILGIGYGIPVTPFGAWSCDLTEDFAKAMLDRHGVVDILVSHSPPKGHCDRTSAGQSVGSEAVAQAVARLAPALC
ncbi:MAG: metallophosphoesterase, partial [Pseudomonadota bacterium]